MPSRRLASRTSYVVPAACSSCDRQFIPFVKAVFLLSLCGELANNDRDPFSRKLAGLILKNALDAGDEAKRMQLHTAWMQLDPTIRQQIKMGVPPSLCALPSPLTAFRCCKP